MVYFIHPYADGGNVSSRELFDWCDEHNKKWRTAKNDEKPEGHCQQCQRDLMRK
jgi:hypothetical protein